jgi:hypothetical protein
MIDQKVQDTIDEYIKVKTALGLVKADAKKLELLDSRYFRNEKFMIIVLKINWRCIDYAHPELYDDSSFILKALSIDIIIDGVPATANDTRRLRTIDILHKINPVFFCSVLFMINAVNLHPDTLYSIAPKLSDDPAFMETLRQKKPKLVDNINAMKTTAPRD